MDTTTTGAESPETERRRLLAAHAALARSSTGYGVLLDDLPQMNDDMERIRDRLVQLGALMAPPVRTVYLHGGPLRGRPLDGVERGAFEVHVELPDAYVGPPRAVYRADPFDPDRWEWTGLDHPEADLAWAGAVDSMTYHRWDVSAD